MIILILRVSLRLKNLKSLKLLRNLPATQAVIKQAILPATTARNISLAKSFRLRGSAAESAPRLIPIAAMLPNPQRMYVDTTALRP